MTLTVLDVGCARHGESISIEPLVEEFRPDQLFGFDPHSSVVTEDYDLDGTRVFVKRAAAWLYDGEIFYLEDGLGTRSTVSADGQPVPCVDLAALILRLDDEIILKMDAEGAEYDLLPDLVARNADLKLKLAWVEWHCPACRYGRFEADDACSHCGYVEIGKRTDVERSLRCEVRQWDL